MVKKRGKHARMLWKTEREGNEKSPCKVPDERVTAKQSWSKGKLHATA